MLGLVLGPSSVVVSLVVFAATVCDKRLVFASNVWARSPLAVLLIPIIRFPAVGAVDVRLDYWGPHISARESTLIQAGRIQPEAPIGSMRRLSLVAVVVVAGMVVVVWPLCRLEFVVAVKISLWCPHQ